MTPGDDSLRDPLSASLGLPQARLRARIPRAVWHTIGLLVAALVTYLIWQAYQSPDFLLDLATWRLC